MSSSEEFLEIAMKDHKIVENVKKRMKPDLPNIDMMMKQVMTPEEIKIENRIQEELQKIMEET